MNAPSKPDNRTLVTVLVALSTLAVTFAVTTGTSWLLFGRDTVTHAEVEQIVQNSSPFAIQRAAIDERFSTINAQIIGLQEEERSEVVPREQVLVQLARLQEQVRALEKLAGRR